MTASRVRIERRIVGRRAVALARRAAAASPLASRSRKRYPTPRTVKMYSGSLASRSSFSRRWRMWTSIVRGSR